MDDPDGRRDVSAELTTLSRRLLDVRFTVAFRGYDPREVHQLLNEIGEDLARVAKAAPAGDGDDPRAERTRSVRLEHVEDQAAEMLRAADEGAKRRATEAQQEADAIMREARSSAELIVAEARNEAARVLDQAVREADVLREEARDTARAAVLESIRSANALVQRARDETGGAATPPPGGIDDVEPQAHGPEAEGAGDASAATTEPAPGAEAEPVPELRVPPGGRDSAG